MEDNSGSFQSSQSSTTYLDANMNSHTVMNEDGVNNTASNSTSTTATTNTVVNRNGDTENALKEFRKAWKSELTRQQNPGCNPKEDQNSTTDNISSIESQARQWFEKAVALERSRKLYDAVSCYRKAMQLMPDIEFKYYRNLRKQHKEREECPVEQAPQLDNGVTDSNYEEEDLVGKFEKLNVDNVGNFYICKSEMSITKPHFSNLPVEVVHYICKWVVTSDLDLRSLEQLSRVCRGLYVLCRDPEIWKLACVKIWGKSTGSMLSEYGNDWRKMFIERPRVNYNGVYISRATYVRQGEAAFRDVDYKPCYLVEYYRYLRFFPDGVVLLLNTPDEPHQCLPKLRYRSARNPSVIRGEYSVSDSIVTAVLKRTHRSVETPSRYKRTHLKSVQTSEHEFHIALEIKTVKGRRNFQLTWRAYTLICRRNNGPETVTTFELSLSKFPPFTFSRVKSYSSEAQNPIT